MTTSATVIMICACVIIFVLLGIAVILTIDIYRRLEVFEELEKRVKNAIKTIVELNKLKNELEEEIFKYKLMRETKEDRKSGIWIIAIILTLFIVTEILAIILMIIAIPIIVILTVEKIVKIIIQSDESRYDLLWERVENMDFRALMNTTEYDFLRTNERLGDRIMLLGLGGSYAYGTNNEGSDIDFRGVTLMLPSDLLPWQQN